MKTLGEYIREIRETQDMSLRELARAIAVSPAFMSDVELGRRHPSDQHLAALALTLQVSEVDLREYDTRPPLQEFRRITASDPAYGFAFRRIIDTNVTAEELLRFVDERGGRHDEGQADE